ncbi:thiamine pyrophosphate-binding protein [Afifella pfennigii]|uniref:thiamine pyrophosphate-binding protein n=1 Tax=Afifella pfennigii TaxID=209897 RepID=UPI00047BE161|nr:thiamine pyrophosphate-binding protein [Afifella pfennigii]
MRGADVLASAIADCGVGTVFSLSGNQIMPLYDALIEPGIRIVHTRHEAAAVFMADGFAQVSGGIGVALVTAAPGFANALGALYSAKMSESPVVFLSGDSPLAQDGRGAFQEFPQVQAARPFVKESLRVTGAADLGRAFAEAAHLARSGRPGPVHLALPFDVLNAEAGDGAASATRAERSSPEFPAEAVREALAVLAAAERPLILTGPSLNATRAPGFAERLEGALAVPVLSMESPRGLRDPALGAAADILGEADAVLYLGKAVDFTSGFGAPFKDASIIVVDPEPEMLERARRNGGEAVALGIVAEAPAFAEALIGKAGAVPARKVWRARLAEALAHRARPHANGSLMPDEIVTCVDAALREAEEAILVCDGGEFGQWAQAFAGAERRVINGPSGAIGGSLPYAIGAKIARPQATVIALMGDGTAGFHFAEFETAARERAGILAVIGNDARWNAEYQIQLRDYGPNRTVGCELSPDARYDLSAAALGCHGEHVKERQGLAPALSRALGSSLPSCINVAMQGIPAPVFSMKAGERH